MKRFLYIFTVFLLISEGFSQSLENKFQRVLDSTYQKNKDAVGILIHVNAPDYQIDWSSSVGVSDKKSKKKLNVSNPVLIASVTKSYVAAAIIKLVENGEISLNQPIEKLICPKSKRKLKKDGYNLDKITVRKLLSHTSLIADYVTDDYFSFVDEHPKYQWSRDEQISLAMKVGNPLPETGKQFNYGDINYLLLSEIIERKTGKKFYKAIRDLLTFEELGLNETWFVDLEETPKHLPDFANQYFSKFNHSAKELNPSWDLYGGGGLASTVKDTALFFQLLFNKKIITNEKLLSELTTYVLPKETSNYCLGFRNLDFSGTKAYYHGGFWGTDVIYLSEFNATIAAFTLQKDKRILNGKISERLISILKKHSIKKQKN